MRILVMEHLTSVPMGLFPAGIISEGRAMRDAVLDDLLAIRETQIVLFSHPDHHVQARPGLRQVEPGPNRGARFRSLVRAADAVLVIAPESGGLLARLCRIVEDEGRLLLGPSAAAVRTASDKWRLHRILRAARLPTPGTVRLLRDASSAALRRAPRPFVLKPRDGYGGLGVSIVRRGDRLRPALTAIGDTTRRNDLLAQEFIPGLPASVSVVVGRPGEAERFCGVPLGLNRQYVSGGRRPIYTGGESGWQHPMAEDAVRMALEAVRALSRAARGCHGYLGVDLILGPGGPVVMEINPRITTSYLGIREVLQTNPAELILDACGGRALPAAVAISKRRRFRCGGPGRATRIVRDRSREVRRCRVISVGTSAASI